jgi:hypothetical protein
MGVLMKDSGLSAHSVAKGNLVRSSVTDVSAELTCDFGGICAVYSSPANLRRSR